MAFFRWLKGVFGFSDNCDDGTNDDSIFDSNVSPRTPYVNPFKKVEEKKEDVVIPVIETPSFEDSEAEDEHAELPEGIFDGLIDVVNANLSPMLVNCIDREAEKKYLYETLGSGFQNYVMEAREKASAMANARIAKERSEMKVAMDAMSERCAATEKRLDEMKAAKQSDDIQKLSLKEKIKGLEQRVATAEAEREQYELESKSLLNKLKVSQVKAEDAELSEGEVARLNEEVRQLKAQLEQKPDVSAVEDEFKAKMEVTNALISDIRNQLVLKENELKTKAGELDAAQKLLAESDERESKLKAELDEAKLNLEIAEEIQAELDKVEAFKQKKNKEVADLNAEIEQLKSSIAQQAEDKETQLAKLEERIRLSQLKEAELTEKVVNLTNNIGEQNKLKNAETQKMMAGAQAELDEANAKLASLEKMVENLKKDIKAKDAKMLELAEAEKMAGDVLKAKVSELESVKAKAASLEGMTEELDRTAKELNRVKLESANALNKEMTESAEKIKTLQAEIAELQARLNVNEVPDDSLVDSDLRQAVDEAFDVQAGDPFAEFDDLGETDRPVELVESAFEPQDKAEISADDNATGLDIDELDDIDWLLPTPPNEPAPATEPEPEPEKEKPVVHDSQMSLF